LSGLDEQDGDIPSCPLCGKIPDYWTINTRRGPTLWLFSKEYRLERDKRYGIHNNMVGEGKYNNFGVEFPFIKGTCMGGCGREIFLDRHPMIFDEIYKMFRRYFPDKIRRTD